MTDGRKTETKSVQAIRGLEARAVSKWEQDGWHLVAQKPGKLRTELTFERERPLIPKKAIIGGAAALTAVAAIFTIGIVSERNDPVAAASASTAAPATAPASSTIEASETTAPTSSQATDPELLTVKNNKDLAALVKLVDNCDDTVNEFAKKYENQTIQFDGAVAAINNHGSYKTRYDILVVPGSAGNKEQFGPTFQYVDVDLIGGLGWSDPDIPNSVERGLKLRFTATVGKYNRVNCLFHLAPVKTEAR